MELLQSVWILYVILPFRGGNVSTIPEYPASLVKTEESLNFVYFPQKIVWSAARAVCQNMGGDLAIIDSKVMMDYIIGRALENYGMNIFVEEYWVGLVLIQDRERYWVADCKNLTFVSNYEDELFDANKQCFRHKHDHIGDQRDCTHEDAFLCQVPSSQPCDVIDLVDSEILSVRSNVTSCEYACLNDPKCWAAVQYAPDNCVQLAFPGHGVDGFKLKSKFCYNVTLNETIIVPDMTNSNSTPDATCGVFSIQPTVTSPPPMASLVLPDCDHVTSSQLLTITEISTETTIEILLETLTATETEISVSTVTEITTDTAPGTLGVTATEISTETILVTETFNVTTTETSTETTTAMFSTTATETSTETLTTTELIIQTTTETFTSATTQISATTLTVSVIATDSQNITFEQAEEVAVEIVKNLTIDTKSTSSHIRRLTSAYDKRQSSRFVGYVGVIFVFAPLVMMLLSDVRKLFLQFCSHDNIYRKGKVSNKKDP